MTAVLVTDAPANSAEWHAARRNGIGASEIGTVVGLSPYDSPYALWLRKKGLIPEIADREVFYWGHALEPVVADRFAELHPEFSVQPAGIHAHWERDWQLASLDRLLVNADAIAPLEIKTSRYGDGYGKHGTDEVPLHVRCQVLQQMDVWSAPFAYVAALIGGSDYREYRIDFDADDAAALRDAGAAFWHSLENDDEPPLDASHHTYEAVRKVNADIDRELTVELAPNLWDDYTAAKGMADNATAALTLAKTRILDAMTTARTATVNATPVLRRQASSTGTPFLKEI